MKKFLLFTILLTSSLLMVTCKDQFDFSMDNLSGTVEQTTELAVPLIDADITIEEILPDNTETSLFLQIDNDNFITLIYEDDLAAVTADSMFDGVFSGTNLPYKLHEEPPREVLLNMDKLINSGRFYFADPKMTMTIKNYWNVATNFKFNEFMYFPKEGDAGILLTGTGVTNWHSVIPSGTNEFVLTEIVLDRTNSNIDEVISSLPHHISAGAFIETVAGGPYDIDPNSVDSVKLKVEMPMDMLIEDLLQLDTIEFSLLNNYENDTDAIDSLIFNLAVNNGFPVDIATQIYFADENYLLLDSLSAGGINLVAGNSENGVNNPVETRQLIIIDKNKIPNIIKASYLLLKIVINTKGAAADETVKLYSNYSIAVKLGARAKLKLKIGL